MTADRIGYLIPEFPGQTHAFFWRELNAMREQQAHVSIISTRCPGAGACRHGFGDQAERETRYVFPPRLGSTLKAILRPVRLWRMLRYSLSLSGSSPKDVLRNVGLVPCAATLSDVLAREQIEHLHVHSFANAAHLAALVHIDGGVPYSLTLHGDLSVYGTDHATKTRGASFVTTVTEPLKEQVVEQAGVEASRVHVIWMGVDTERFKPVEHRHDADAPVQVVTVARLNAMKGHEYALQAIRKLVDRGVRVHYTIAGAGPHQDAIERTVSSLELESHVTLAGSLSEDDVLALLQRSDIFILPSYGLGEAAPVSVMEAMACGVAVICSRIGGTPQMIDDDIDGLLVAQQDVGAIETALGRLATDALERSRIAEAGRRRAEEQFDYRVMAGRLLRTIQASHNGQADVARA